MRFGKVRDKMSTTTTGKNLNLTIEDLSGMEIELRPLEPGGGGWDIGGKLFRGELYDERTDEKVGDIECLVTDAGRVVCRFPEWGVGGTASLCSLARRTGTRQSSWMGT